MREQRERRGSRRFWWIVVVGFIGIASALSNQRETVVRVDARNASIDATWQAALDNGTVGELLATQAAEYAIRTPVWERP